MPSDFREMYAMSSWMFAQWPLEDALRAMADAGFTWVEIWADKTHLDPRLKPDVPAVKSLVKQLGLKVHSIHAPFHDLDLGAPDESLKGGWLETVGASLESAAALEAETAVLHVSSHHFDLAGDEAYARSRQITREFVHELNERAGALGVRLALENILASPERRIGYSLQELATLFPEPELGFCLDAGHTAVNGFNLEAEAAAVRGRLLSVHAANNDGQADLHWIPGRGVLDWQKVKQALADNGYRGVYVLEVYGGEDPRRALAEAVAFARQDRPPA